VGATLTEFLLLLLLKEFLLLLPPLMVYALMPLMVFEGLVCVCSGTWAAFRGKKRTMTSFHNRCS
jgi:predicted component of type VI protein secretion system